MRSAIFSIALIGALFAATASAPRAQPAADAVFDTLAGLLTNKMREYRVPGAALGVVRDGHTTIRGLGVTNVEDPLPVTAHTVFPIASISKTFAATAIMRLVEQGKIDLHAPVRTTCPTSAFATKRRAATSPSGICSRTRRLGRAGVRSGSRRPRRSRTSSRRRSTDLMQVAPPGAAWSYNNAGFSIAGRVIEVVTGKPINRAIRRSRLPAARPRARGHDGVGEFIVQRFARGHTSTRNGTRRDASVRAVVERQPAGGVAMSHHRPADVRALSHGRRHRRGRRARRSTRATLELHAHAAAAQAGHDDDIGIAWHLRTVGSTEPRRMAARCAGTSCCSRSCRSATSHRHSDQLEQSAGV